MTCSFDPVPGFTAPVAGPGLLDGFSFLFTETDNFGCPVVAGDELSPLSDTIPHTVPDSFSDTLEDSQMGSLLNMRSDPLQSSDIDVPCPGQAVPVHRFSGVSQPLAGSSCTQVPPAVPQSHFDPASTPHWDDHPTLHSSNTTLVSQGHLGPGHAPLPFTLLWYSHLPRRYHGRSYPFQFGPLRPCH